MAAVVIADDFVLPEGGVAVGIGGGVGLAGLTAQGCGPIGNALMVMRAKGNILERLGNRPALSMLEMPSKDWISKPGRGAKGMFFWAWPLTRMSKTSSGEISWSGICWLPASQEGL